MRVRPERLPSVPTTTAAAVQAACPKGNRYVDLRAECGTLYAEHLLADLYPPQGRPVEVAPWRWALVMVRQDIEGLTDRPAAEAVRRCLDGQYALSLELPDPGCNVTLLHDFRQRWLTHAGAQRWLDTFLPTCQERGWIKARGCQRTASPYVVAAIRRLYSLECGQAARHHARTQLSEAAPAWVRGWAPLAWYERYGPRAALCRLPTAASKRAPLARGIGTAGDALREALWHDARARHLWALPAGELLRQIGLPHYDRCPERGLEAIRWRAPAAQPPSSQLIQAPYAPEARDSSQRSTHWVGSKGHLPATCDASYPDLITHVSTTPATTSAVVLGAPIEQDVAERPLLPEIHVLDSGYVVADVLVSAPRTPQIEVGGPLQRSSSRQAREGQGFDVLACLSDWDAQPARCPQGHSRVKGTPGHSPEGHEVMRIRCAKATCDACRVRQACPSSTKYPRQITGQPPAQHEAIRAAHARQSPSEFKERSALRAGVESTIAQGVRRVALRRSRSRGWAKTHCQQTIKATAMHVVRGVDWLWGQPLGEQRRLAGHLARLVPTSGATGSLAYTAAT